MTGRARDGILVHFAPTGDNADRVRPGDVITTRITAAAPHHLLADEGVLSYRATRAGDRHEAGEKPETPPIGVGLGLPTLRRDVAVDDVLEKGCPT